MSEAPELPVPRTDPPLEYPTVYAFQKAAIGGEQRFVFSEWEDIDMAQSTGEWIGIDASSTIEVRE